MFGYWWKKITLRKYAHLQKKILVEQKKTSPLSLEKLKTKIKTLRQKIRKDKDLNKHLVSAFSLTREVIKRQIGLWLFPTQIFGGIALHYGNIAQMNTGEGKTLTALLPICLNALSGNPVYVITVNEYLAERDWKLGKLVFDFFDITSGFNSNTLTAEEKRELYAKCTIVYTTGSELGFDYLRNNLVTSLEDKSDLRFSYALLDEVDSILIDESQNPLIISQRWGSSELTTKEKHQKSTYLAQQLIKKTDYKVDQKERELWLTRKGIKKVEKFYGISNLFSFQNQEINYLLHNSLKAKHFYQKGVEYVVDPERKKIVIIDSLTGRLVPNRVYSGGIQQAVESKEGLPVSPSSKSTAVITYQNFFRLFNKLAGMTGTAKSEAEEFRQVYGMEVVTIRPYRKLIRKDYDDLIFWNKKTRDQWVVEKIKSTKQPKLIGTSSVEESERLSFLLTQTGVPHSVLNAVLHHQEAEIVKKAGQIGAVTVSTNMAGRGTDIILSEESRKAGGLLVIGLGRNPSRRIDNQLRGRAGRQGDPGESQFCISLEDELIKNYAVKEQITRIFRQGNLREAFQKPLKSKWFNMMVAEPQEMLRNLQTSHRQYTLNNDLLINHQRQIIYNQRQKILSSSNVFTLVQRKKTMVNNESQPYLKSQLVRVIDFAWANYLESLEKTRQLINIKSWLPQDVQEAFFWESSKLFQITQQHINKRIRKILAVDSISNLT